ncbi:MULTISPECIES: PD-(D/E)XK nuclease family protein [unclassified Legionella]|uniref:PD-(D/E)XK nuclease family protein n=1 Tax=unclassified Legionella TaxID=2622702 RepID=UPI003AF4F9E1
MNNKTQLLTLMREGAIVITPNNRLSTELLNDFFAAVPLSIQDKPRCFPYRAFLLDTFKKIRHKNPHTNYPIVLTTQQLRHLWRQILSNHASLPVNEGLLKAVEEAWTRCHLWQLDFHHPAFSYTAQTRQFQQWARQLQQELDKLDAITEDELATYLSTQQNILDAQPLIWACFDDYTPQQKALQKLFNAQGCQIYHYDLAPQPAIGYQCIAQNDDDEQQQLIHWIKGRLAQGETHIAVVVPDLQIQSQGLQRLLQQQFPVEQFNLSLGQALADYPLVAHALCWLHLDGKTITAQQARLLLHSPYLAYSQTEMLARAQCMEDSSSLRELNIASSTLIKDWHYTAPKLAKVLENITAYPEHASPQTWANAFKTRLAAMGFPGEYPLDSATYQCYQRFLIVFDEFKQLALITPSMNKEQALLTLNELLKSTIFQPKKAKAVIQVLGLLEASGCLFESLWVTGLTDQCLPQKARLSAFIPISLQRAYSMPHADPLRELQLAQKTLARLKNSSAHTVFSYSRLSKDQPNMPSPLLVDLETYYAPLIETVAQQSHLTSFNETYYLPLIDNENIRGGTAILANQAKCPFRAFAAHRLHVRAAAEMSTGPDAMERGQLIHKIMELLWQTLQTQENLLSLDEGQLNELIVNAITSAIEPLVKQRPSSFSTLIQDVELVRLKRLVHACLTWERQRPPFSVDALEQTFTINLAGIDFYVRVDRLDNVAENKKWVIDYKSSLPQSLPWKEDRPQEPQLLLYALLDETINALLFAQLKAGQLTCKGLSAETYPVPGIIALKKDENWVDYRQHWQSQLNDLAGEFSQGHCPPRPNNGSVCQNCDYQSLCRFRNNL